MHEVLVNRLGGLSLPRKSVVRLTDRPDMTLDVYRGRKTTTQQQLLIILFNFRTIKEIIISIPILMFLLCKHIKFKEEKCSRRTDTELLTECLLYGICMKPSAISLAGCLRR